MKETEQNTTDMTPYMMDKMKVHQSSLKSQLLNNEDGYVTVPWEIMGMLSGSEVTTLAYLIDAEDVATCRLKEDTEWFMVDTSFVSNRIPWMTKDRLKSPLSRLIEYGLVEKKEVRIKYQLHRFIKINRQALNILKANYYLITSGECAFTKEELSEIYNHPATEISEEVLKRALGITGDLDYCQSDTSVVPNQHQGGAKSAPRWCQISTKVVPKWHIINNYYSRTISQELFSLAKLTKTNEEVPYGDFNTLLANTQKPPAGCESGTSTKSEEVDNHECDYDEEEINAHLRQFVLRYGEDHFCIDAYDYHQLKVNYPQYDIDTVIKDAAYWTIKKNPNNVVRKELIETFIRNSPAKYTARYDKPNEEDYITY